MTKGTRSIAIGLAIVLATANAAPVAAAASEPDTTGIPVVSRVRPRTPALIAAINDAIRQSPTFSRLVEAINASDGIVYVEQGDCRHRLGACLVAVTAAGPHRVLHVRVDRRQLPWKLAWLIGHELQHAIEVLSDPRVTDNAAMSRFYAREGRQGRPQMFETDAAIQAGNDVRADIHRYARRPSTP